MSERVKIVIPDAGPINTLAAAGLLPLLLAPKNVDLVLIKSVVDEIVIRAPELNTFLHNTQGRILVVHTSICEEDDAKRQRGEPIGRGRGDLAIADFILHGVDDVIGNSPALVIYEDRKLGRLGGLDGFSEKTHFMTTAAYLRKLEQEGVIASFAHTWKQIVDANRSPDPSIHREPNSEEVETPSSRPRGSTIPLR